jgi:hypothetical protein
MGVSSGPDSQPSIALVVDVTADMPPAPESVVELPVVEELAVMDAF